MVRLVEKRISMTRTRLVHVCWALMPLAGIVVAVAAWEFFVSRSDSLFFSPPSEVFQAFRADYIDGDFARVHLWPSFWRMSRGWLIAIVGGIGVGTLLGLNSWLLSWVNPLLHFSRAIPPPALVGVFFIAFGAGDAPKVALIALGATWPVLFNSIEAARTLNSTQTETATSLRLSRTDRIFGVVLPAMAPKIFPGIRSSLAIALILMVLTEFTSSINGIGKVLADQRNFFDWPGVWSTLVVLALLGLSLNAVLVVIERRVIGWHEAMTGER